MNQTMLQPTESDQNRPESHVPAIDRRVEVVTGAKVVAEQAVEVIRLRESNLAGTAVKHLFVKKFEPVPIVNEGPVKPLTNNQSLPYLPDPDRPVTGTMLTAKDGTLNITDIQHWIDKIANTTEEINDSKKTHWN